MIADVKNIFKTAVPPDAVAEFCRRNGIRKLSLFGSILTDRFGPDSDVDVLVEFDRERVPGLFGIAHMQSELSDKIGRPEDLRTPDGLSDRFRMDVLAQAAVQYERA